MRSILFTTICLFFFARSISQSEIPGITLACPEGFRTVDDVTASYDSFRNVYHINFQDGKKLYRKVYDTGFNLLREYQVNSTDLLLTPKELTRKVTFILPLVTKDGYYEVYGNTNVIEVYKPDFETNTDVLVERFKFNPSVSGKAVMAVIPGSGGLKLVSFDRKKDILIVQSGIPGKGMEQIIFPLPQKSFNKEDEKTYGKEGLIRLGTLWSKTFSPSQVNNPQQIPSENRLYFTNEKIYMLTPMPHAMGFFMIALDLKNHTIDTHNFVVNRLQLNAEEVPVVTMQPVSMIFDSILVIQNSSFSAFEYFFFNLTTKKLVRKFRVNVDDSLYKLVHSPLKQKGTFASQTEEKEISREQAFMRKINGSFEFITLPRMTIDSIVFMLSRSTEVRSPVGIPHPIGRSPGFFASRYRGNAFFAPYEAWTVNKLLYTYSMFNRHTFEPSPSKNVESLFDRIVRTFTETQLTESSTILVERDKTIIIGLLNPKNKVYQLYRFTQGN